MAPELQRAIDRARALVDAMTPAGGRRGLCEPKTADRLVSNRLPSH
jgi:hypothetical protein